MKLFTHRGWSAGEIENSFSAFRKSVEAGVDGVEFDVRYDADDETVVCAHDKVTDNNATTLDDVLKYLSSTKLELLIEIKEASGDFYIQVVEVLQKHNVVGRTTIFAFHEEAKNLPWGSRGDIKLGIIAEYPHDIKKYIEMYNPDMVLLGWGNKKQRLQFRIAWTFLSLKKTFSRYPAIKFVIGVAYGSGDKKWLSKQEGLYGITADML